MNEYIWVIIAGFGVFLLLYIITSYNTLIKDRNRVKTQWAQIDVQLVRRTDLIPNLIECVKGYTKHETETLERVIQARTALTRAETPEKAMKANAQLSAALPCIFALSEAYPALKADSSFLHLQNELSETESKIAYSRQFYNDTVLLYKNKIEQFPRNIVAKLFGFKQEGFFIADEESKKNVQVKF